MKSHCQVAVIGGGVVGASVLYHLTKGGWKDVVLIERSELTSGSTWHAAGGMHTLNGDPNVAKLQQYTINLYKEIEAISGVSCGMHVTGGLNLAGTKERLDWLKMARARGRYLGMNLEIISIDEAAKMYPFIDKKHFVGAMFDPVEGHLDPWGVTQAYAKCATMAGAEINRFTRVVDLKPRPDGSWDVVTDKGDLVAEHVVNCGGLWAREVGRMVGLELPVLAMEHHYLITEDIPGVIDPKVDKFHVIDFEGEIYMRQEGGGMLIGTYEQACQPWSRARDAVGLRPESAAQRPRSHRAESGDRVRALPRTRQGGHPQGRQRPLHLRAGRQSADRAGEGPEEFLGRLRRHGGLQPGRRRRPRARQLDDRGRSRPRRLGHGRRALRRLGDLALHQRQGARELLAPLPHPFPQRGAAGGAAVAHDADLRSARRGKRRVRGILQPRKSRCGSRRRAWSRAKRRRSAAPTPSSTSAGNAAPCAQASA